MRFEGKVFLVTGGGRGIGHPARQARARRHRQHRVDAGAAVGAGDDTDEVGPRDERRKPRLRRIVHAQHPAGQVGRPEDVAALCAWLLSDEAGFVTGACVVRDGGMTRKMIYR